MYQVESDSYLVIDESSHSFDLQHVGLVSPQLMNQTVCSSVVPANNKKYLFFLFSVCLLIWHSIKTHSILQLAPTAKEKLKCNFF